MRYFALSYAQGLSQDGVDPFTEIFQDVSVLVRDATGASHRHPVGAVVRSDRLAGAAGDTVRDEIARCKVLVPLYSPRYLNSADCGRVVTAFVQRGRSPGGAGVPPIAPLLWIPPVRPWPPVPALPLEVANVDRYNKDGLFELMLSRNEPEASWGYDAVLDALARRIVDLAERTSLPAAGAVHPRDLANAFARRTSPPRVAIHVLAPDLARLPAGRDPSRYGSSALRWNPYGHGGPEGLGSRMETMARSLGYQPTLAAVDDIDRDVCGRDPPVGPAILLLDPWALDHTAWRDQLRAFDRQDRPWVSIMAAWDLADPQTARAHERLLHQLNTTLESRFRMRRPGLHLDAHVASTLPDVGRVLPSLLQESTRRYLRWMSRWRDR